MTANATMKGIAFAWSLNNFNCTKWSGALTPPGRVICVLDSND